MEIWKDVKNYEGSYEVSSLGRIRSVSRFVKTGGSSRKFIKGKIIKKQLGKNNYNHVVLSLNKKKTTRTVHQLVAESFLGHIPCGHKLVVNHIDLNKVNNNLNNLEIVTARENLNQKHLKSSSKYTGVNWCKTTKKWVSSIFIKGKKKTLGRFNSELKAHNTYQEALKNII